MVKHRFTAHSFVKDGRMLKNPDFAGKKSECVQALHSELEACGCSGAPMCPYCIGGDRRLSIGGFFSALGHFAAETEP